MECALKKTMRACSLLHLSNLQLELGARKRRGQLRADLASRVCDYQSALRYGYKMSMQSP